LQNIDSSLFAIGFDFQYPHIEKDAQRQEEGSLGDAKSFEGEGGGNAHH